jgi:hypothetical protein
VTFVATEQHLRTPYSLSWNFTVQHQLFQNMVADITYVGKQTLKLEGHRTWNPAVYKTYPITGAAPTAANANDRVLYSQALGLFTPACRILGNDFRAWYQSFQASVNRRFSRGLSIIGSYVLSKNLDNVVSSDAGLAPGVGNPFNIAYDKGRSQYDRRHAMTLSWVWSPTVKLNNALANRVIGGWSVTGLTSIQSGAPVTIVEGTDVALDGTGGASRQHAQLAPGATVATITVDHPDQNAFISKFFNPAAFVPANQVPRGTYGNAGRGIISGPASNSSDLAALKNIALREPFRIQFRAELFNAFNQVTFNAPVSSTTSTTLGRITGAGPGRTIQLALKAIW